MKSIGDFLSAWRRSGAAMEVDDARAMAALWGLRIDWLQMHRSGVVVRAAASSYQIMPSQPFAILTALENNGVGEWRMLWEFLPEELSEFELIPMENGLHWTRFKADVASMRAFMPSAGLRPTWQEMLDALPTREQIRSCMSLVRSTKEALKLRPIGTAKGEAYFKGQQFESVIAKREGSQVNVIAIPKRHIRWTNLLSSAASSEAFQETFGKLESRLGGVELLKDGGWGRLDSLPEAVHRFFFAAQADQGFGLMRRMIIDGRAARAFFDKYELLDEAKISAGFVPMSSDGRRCGNGGELKMVDPGAGEGLKFRLGVKCDCGEGCFLNAEPPACPFCGAVSKLEWTFERYEWACKCR